MKHVETIIQEGADKLRKNDITPHLFHSLLLTLSMMYKDKAQWIKQTAYTAAGQQIQSIAPVQSIVPLSKDQKEAVYDETKVDTGECLTCGQSQPTTANIAEAQAIAPKLVELSEDDKQVEAFIKASNAKGLVKFLKGLGVKIANDESKDLELLINIYANYKQGK